MDTALTARLSTAWRNSTRASMGYRRRLQAFPAALRETWSGSCSPDASNPILHLTCICLYGNQSPFWNEAHNQWTTLIQPGQYEDAARRWDGFAFTARTMPEAMLHGSRGRARHGLLQRHDLNTTTHGLNFATSDSWLLPSCRHPANRMYLIAATSHGLPIRSVEGAPLAVLRFHQQWQSTFIHDDLRRLQNAGISWKISKRQDTVNKNGRVVRR